MKFYETTNEEYLQSVKRYNLHPEMATIYNKMPDNIANFGNIIIYGPVGIGKHSQVLYLLEKYSPSHLKYEKKIQIITEKQTYNYKISDIHYEIDMSLLGCNSKLLWHEIFLQIVDIISVKQQKTGIILCKNFHLIHNELLEIFYSYIQQYNHSQTAIQIKYIIVTEHISFIPNNILNSCGILSLKRPSKESYIKIAENQSLNIIDKYKLNIESLISNTNITGSLLIENNQLENIIMEINHENIINCKEIHSFALLKENNELPKDVFNVICNNIIQEMNQYKKMVFTNFRDTLYDILVYNLDVFECIYYILSHYIVTQKISGNDISDILVKIFTFFKYYNNNYRPIYHLEMIFIFIIMKINKIQYSVL